MEYYNPSYLISLYFLAFSRKKKEKKNTNLVFVPIQFHGRCMSKKQVVSNNVGFCSGVTGSTISSIARTSPRCKSTAAVTIHGPSIWFIQCDPMLDSISKCFAAKIHISYIILPIDKTGWLLIYY